MPDIVYTPFDKQIGPLLSQARIKGMFAAKRSGKSEIAYIDTIQKCEQQPNYVNNGRDPFLVANIAPTHSMLKKLVWPKFRSFAKPFENKFLKDEGGTFHWKGNNSLIYGISAEKIERIEGLKLHHVHLTEVFQMKKAVLMEVLARVADTQGTITMDGSLGTNIVNPKAHWVYELFKKQKFQGADIFEWYTKDNPHFPREELQRLRETLDPLTYRQLFEMDWDTIPTNAVYSDWSEANEIVNYQYDPGRETYISIDWGYAHPMAVGFYQYDPMQDTVYKFGEIVKSRITLDQLWDRIISFVRQFQHFSVDEWICDIAGNQEREQTGKSNIKWFKEKHQIVFKKRRTAVTYGIPIVRSYIKTSMGKRKFFIDKARCPKSIDGLKRYHYKEKDGRIVNENPVKVDDDANDEMRYLYINILDKQRGKASMTDYRLW